MQSEGLYRIVKDHVPQNAISKKNSGRSWLYGYNEQYDMVVISRTGQIGEIVNIQGLNVALPLAPKECYQRSKTSSMQYWEREDLPKELLKIQSIFHWNEMPSEFKDRWVDYIEGEFNRREEGMWFMNNGTPTYITGAHYMYLQWSSIDVGYADPTKDLAFVLREASLLIAVDIWQSRQLSNAGGVPPDGFTPSPYRMGNTLLARVRGLIANYLNPNGLVG